MASRTRLSIGDGEARTGQLLYAHYLRHCELAANNALVCGTHATLKRADLTRFSMGIFPSDVVDIRSTLICASNGVDEECDLLHEFMRAGQVVATCLAAYTVSGLEGKSCEVAFGGARAIRNRDEKLRIRAQTSRGRVSSV